MIYIVSHASTTRLLIEDMAIAYRLPEALQHAGCTFVDGVWEFPTDNLPLVRDILCFAYTNGFNNIREDAIDDLEATRARIAKRLATYDRLLGDKQQED